MAPSRLRQTGLDHPLKQRAQWAERRFAYRFQDLELLTRALTHSSASSAAHNERLEFLGDAFLNFAIARALYLRDPHAPEGDLSRQRATLVRRATLADLGHELDLERQLILGPGESRNSGGARSSLLANAVEALIGAVLLDGGSAAAEALVDRLFASRVEQLPEAAALKDAKTRLQERLQAEGHALPTYVLEAVRGPPHHRSFRVNCVVSERELRSSGEGLSRRQAEQAAAAAMLRLLEPQQ